MPSSTNLGLPYIDANQNQKYVTHNTALQILDALVQIQVQSATLTAPPGSPSDGQAWIVASGGTGAWLGKDLQIAAWQSGAWAFFPPRAGYLAYNVATATTLVWTGSAWISILAALSTLMLTALGIGTAADLTNPLSVLANAILFNALTTGAGGTGDMRVKLSKAAAANTASFLFQDAFSGRAEIGLTGDDNFHFKVSPDGTTFRDGIIIDKTTGAVTLGNARTAVADAAYTALTTDRLVAFTTLTAARAVTLPAASATPAGVSLIVVDESGACSAVKTITINRSGSDTINGAASTVLSYANAFVAIESDGSSKWTIVDQSTLGMAQQAANAVAITGGTIDATAIGGTTPATGKFTGLTAATNGVALNLIEQTNNAGVEFDYTRHTDSAQRAFLTIYPTINPPNVDFIFGSTSGLWNSVSLQSGGGRLFLNAAGNVGLGTTSPAVALDVAGITRPGTYTVATVPAGVAGGAIYVSNGRKVGEGAGAGTGVRAVYSNGQWRRLSDDTTVAA